MYFQRKSIVAIELILRLLAIYCGALIAFWGMLWLWFQCMLLPERVTVETLDGQRMSADVIGASKLRRGEWQRAKVRFYGPDGEGAWTQGDGYKAMGVMRKEGISLSARRGETQNPKGDHSQ